jgi:hypothetical protein
MRMKRRIRLLSAISQQLHVSDVPQVLEAILQAMRSRCPC